MINKEDLDQGEAILRKAFAEEDVSSSVANAALAFIGMGRVVEHITKRLEWLQEETKAVGTKGPNMAALKALAMVKVDAELQELLRVNAVIQPYVDQITQGEKQ